MIVGLFLRNIKTYQGLNYIPISDKEKFTGLVGANGIGKSSVLESLDGFFNSKTWNYHSIVRKSGLSTTRPHIVPVFIIEKSALKADYVSHAEILSDVAKNFSESDAGNKSLVKVTKQFVEHREKIARNINFDDFYLLPIGYDHDLNVSVSIFNSKVVPQKGGSEGAGNVPQVELGELSDFSGLLKSIKEEIDYIYIPREIDPDTFTKLETDEIQKLMGETLNDVLSREVPEAKIREINDSLNSFIEKLSRELDIYSYRTPGQRQQYLKKADLYKLIIQAFFSIRKLHKKAGTSWLEISQLSSGEKQKAIIDVAHGFLKHHRDSAENLILAIDEPESSLHMSSCYDQFDSLYQISKDCRQVIISTHWYGFFPTIDSGNATIITMQESEHRFDILNLASHREEIKQMSAASKGRLPYDIRLKSTNDLIQSIITSAIGDEPFHWIICEGSSEKIYFEKYFEDLKVSKKLRIVPVGGAKEIKRIYGHLSTAYEDFKSEIAGKIVLISDTDASLVDYDVSDYQNLICKRIVSCASCRDTILVNIHSNPKSPETEIEDALDVSLFLETLNDMRDRNAGELDFLEGMTPAGSGCVHFSLDLRMTEKEAISQFFDRDNNKYRFARRYVELMRDVHQVPSWINEIRSWLES